MFPVSLRLFPGTVNPSGEPKEKVEGRIDERGGREKVGGVEARPDGGA